MQLFQNDFELTLTFKFVSVLHVSPSALQLLCWRTERPSHCGGHGSVANCADATPPLASGGVSPGCGRVE